MSVGVHGRTAGRRRYLVKNNLFAPIFALFRDNRGRDNLINSAIIELVEVQQNGRNGRVVRRRAFPLWCALTYSAA